MRCRSLFRQWLLLLLTVPAMPALGQSDDSAAATETAQTMETFVVLGQPISRADPIETRRTLGPDELVPADVGDVGDIMRLAPSAHVRTNSRGETLVFLRGAGERETAIYFDGALLNVPWDNRIDLNVLPANMVGAAAVVSGPLSARYGARAAGGAVELYPVAAVDSISSGRIEGGEAGAFRANASTSLALENMSLSLAGGYLHHGDAPLADALRVPFSQESDDRRTNTDLSLSNFAGHLALDREDTRFGLSLLYAASRQGVAPESDRDPETENVRYWRYPDSDLAMAIASLSHEFGPRTEVNTVFWLQTFNQLIDSYESDRFEAIDTRQDDRNRTWGSRGNIRFGGFDRNLTLSYSGLISTHREREFDPAGDGPGGPGIAPLVYREGLVTLGAEFEDAINDDWRYSFDVGFDWLATLMTGDKPDPGDFRNVSFGAGLVRRIDSKSSLRAALGRKARQPTLRELYGTALNRFLANPSLKSETSWMGEAGFARVGPLSKISVTAFVRRIQDALDQRNVEVDGQRLRQRINLRGVDLYGLEVEGDHRLTDEIRIFGHLMFLHARRLVDAPEDERLLAERPNLLLRAAAEYARPEGFSLRVEVVHTGRAYSPDTEDVFVPLEISTQLNFRAAYDLAHLIRGVSNAEIYLRVDNATNAFVEPQIGLPAPGRWVRGGLRVTF